MIQIAKSDIGLETLYGILGFTGDCEEELKKIIPFEAPEKAEIPLDAELDLVPESSAFGPEADTFFDSLNGATRVRDIPQGIPLTTIDSIKNTIITELRRSERITEDNILELLGTTAVVLREGVFI